MTPGPKSVSLSTFFLLGLTLSFTAPRLQARFFLSFPRSTRHGPILRQLPSTSSTSFISSASVFKSPQAFAFDADDKMGFRTDFRHAALAIAAPIQPNRVTQLSPSFPFRLCAASKALGKPRERLARLGRFEFRAGDAKHRSRSGERGIAVRNTPGNRIRCN